jgi:hypothetical protein
MFWPWRVQAFPDQWDPADPLRRNPGRYLNMIQWDGYQGDRQVILDALAANGMQNTLVLSGDSHVGSAAQVASEVEFGPSSVTSASAREQSRDPSTSVVLPLLTNANPGAGLTVLTSFDVPAGNQTLTDGPTQVGSGATPAATATRQFTGSRGGWRVIQSPEVNGFS